MLLYPSFWSQPAHTKYTNEGAQKETKGDKIYVCDVHVIERERGPYGPFASFLINIWHEMLLDVFFIPRRNDERKKNI